MTAHPEIQTLVRQVASRHHCLLALRVLFLTLAVAAGLCVAGSLAWVLRGRGVPAAFPLVVAALAAVTGLAIWQFRKMSPAAAIRECDRFFNLKDAITSARHLAATAPDDPATALQWKWLVPRLAECRPAAITAPFPKRTAMLSGLLAAVAVWLALLPPSPAVQAAEKEARDAQVRIAESKDQLEQLIEALDKDIVAPDEKDALKLDEFRKLVKSIDENGDRKEAARQFARIEQKVRDSSRALDQKRDEETVKLAAAELAKAEETDARQLGKKLDAKEFREAAEMLAKLDAKKIDPKDLKNPATKQQNLTESKEEMARMRAISKRLAAAGKQRQGARQAQAGKGDGKHGQGEGAANGEGAAGQGGPGKPLEDLMAEIDAAAAEIEKNLEAAEADPDAEWSDEPMEKANGALGKLGKHLKGMHAKRMAKSKLDQLRDGLAQAQSFSQGQTKMLGVAPGGKEAGTGSSWSERKERDDSQKNGQLAQLQGQHGSGPSLSAVEDAESGTGVSGRRGEARQREFTRQAESFVQRDDVPESLKLGVRNYFENLQSAAPAAAPDK
jgi:hypothetical protein